MSKRSIDTAGVQLAERVIPDRETAVHSRSARARTLKLDLSTRLCRAREAAGLAQKEVARQQLTSAWENGEEPHAPTALAVALMPAHARPVAIEMVRFQADHLDLTVLNRSRVLHGSNHVVRLSVVTSECTDPPRALASALALAAARADGQLTDDELEAIRLEARQAAEAVLELDAWAVEELLRRRASR